MADRARSGTVVDTLVSRALTNLYRAFLAVTILFLMAPILIVIIVSFAEDPYATGLPESFTLQWYETLPDTLGYLGMGSVAVTSVQLALVTALITVVIGGLAAIGIVRYDPPYVDALQTYLISPLIYPWLVVGLSLLLLVARLNSMFGLDIQLSFWTLLAGHIIFTIPYTLRSVGASLQNYNYSLDEASMNLGATELDTYLNVTLPLIKPGIISGAILVFILSFNQYIISLFLSSPKTQTMPLLMFSIVRSTQPAQTAAVGTIVMLGVLSIVFIAEYAFGISDFL